jgi:hypothetical protein
VRIASIVPDQWFWLEPSNKGRYMPESISKVELYILLICPKDPDNPLVVLVDPVAAAIGFIAAGVGTFVFVGVEDIGCYLLLRSNQQQIFS